MKNIINNLDANVIDELRLNKEFDIMERICSILNKYQGHWCLFEVVPSTDGTPIIVADNGAKAFWDELPEDSDWDDVPDEYKADGLGYYEDKEIVLIPSFCNDGLLDWDKTQYKTYYYIDDVVYAFCGKHRREPIATISGKFRRLLCVTFDSTSAESCCDAAKTLVYTFGVDLKGMEKRSPRIFKDLFGDLTTEELIR